MKSASSPDFVVYIVDDDPPMRDSLSLMLGVLGYRTASFDSAETFLKTYRDDCTGCVVADLKLPGKSGLDLQRELRARGARLPFIVITGHGDVNSARTAFLEQAVDFLEKPFDEADLRRAIEKSVEQEARRHDERHNPLSSKLVKLTARERDVLRLLGEGLHAKEIGRALGISARTVEVHKASLMGKLEARNTAGLVRYALEMEKDGRKSRP